MPDSTMILQGTDSLSRGIWASSFNNSYQNIMANLFHPAPPSPALLSWALHQVGCPLLPTLFSWWQYTNSWARSDLVGHSCIWSLSPTVAQQGFTTATISWVEQPCSSAHICIVPCLLQWDFGQVNKHILFCGQHSDLPLPPHFDPLVAFALFYFPPFVRSLQHGDPHLDESPFMPCPYWVQAQVDYLHGL